MLKLYKMMVSEDQWLNNNKLTLGLYQEDGD
jgi:hypothetical protein